MDMLPTGKKEIDVLFASAGVDELIKPLGSITAKGFEDTLNVNVRGPSLQYKRQCRS
jgi:NAD(P)-dependent dehydrogenase (short-subunit alcohol dehydrogenase family)